MSPFSIEVFCSSKRKGRYDMYIYINIHIYKYIYIYTCKYILFIYIYLNTYMQHTVSKLIDFTHFR